MADERWVLSGVRAGVTAGEVNTGRREEIQASAWSNQAQVYEED